MMEYIAVPQHYIDVQYATDTIPTTLHCTQQYLRPTSRHCASPEPNITACHLALPVLDITLPYLHFSRWCIALRYQHDVVHWTAMLSQDWAALCLCASIQGCTSPSLDKTLMYCTLPSQLNELRHSANTALDYTLRCDTCTST